MAQAYNPIVRVFGRLRQGLMSSLNLSRRQVHPGVLLAALVPIPQRRRVWRQLWHAGLPMPALELSPGLRLVHILEVFFMEVWLCIIFQHWITLLAVFPIGLFVFTVSRPLAI